MIAHRPRPSTQRGFTLLEILVMLTLTAAIVVAILTILRTTAANGFTTVNATEARSKAAAALDMIVADLQAAGSGTDAGYAVPQRAIVYVDSTELMLCADLKGGDTAPLDTLAYDPAGSPRPFHLTGAYAPPIKYRTGAELIRWTMDLDNDGQVDPSDTADAQGIDAARSPNAADFTLVRQTYADSLTLVAGDNGGAVERIAPILKPGGAVPPLFTVTFTDGTTWDWSAGAVPAGMLKNIASVRVQVTAESARPDSHRQYSRVTLTTTVSLKRVG